MPLTQSCSPSASQVSASSAENAFICGILFSSSCCNAVECQGRLPAMGRACAGRQDGGGAAGLRRPARMLLGFTRRRGPGLQHPGKPANQLARTSCTS